jgi:hypothetical protein
MAPTQKTRIYTPYTGPSLPSGNTTESQHTTVCKHRENDVFSRLIGGHCEFGKLPLLFVRRQQMARTLTDPPNHVKDPPARDSTVAGLCSSSSRRKVSGLTPTAYRAYTLQAIAHTAPCDLASLPYCQDRAAQCKPSCQLCSAQYVRTAKPPSPDLREGT